MKIKITQPDSTLYDGEATLVQLPGTGGLFEILNNHAPIISALQKGVVEFVNSEGRHQLNINGGFVEVKKNLVSLCVEVI